MIEQGYEWQVRELADAADRVAQRYAGKDGLTEHHRASYAQGVRDVLRLLVGDLASNGGPGVTAELAAILSAADVATHEPSDPADLIRGTRVSDFYPENLPGSENRS
jgi:hypothetical protein